MHDIINMNNQNPEIPVMLSIKQTAEKFGLPVHFVRQAVKDGRIYGVQAGSKKIYINQDSVISYLSGPNLKQEEK